MKKNLISAFALGLIIFSSCEQKAKVSNAGTTQASVSKATETKKISPEEFTQKAYKGNKMEIQLGQMAQKKASNKQVKEYSSMLVKDHSKANDKLTEIAKTKNIQLADTLGQAALKEKMNKLEGKTGAAFDQAYMEMIVKEHKKDQEMYQSAINDLQDQALKEYATTTLQIIEQHLKKGQEITKTISEAKASAK